MAKDEWGTKRSCPKCSTRFYDLQTDPMTCPACGHVFTLESITTQRGRTVAPEKAKAAAKAVVTGDDDDVVIDDEESDVDLGDDLLEDDDDNVSLDELTDVADEDDET